MGESEIGIAARKYKTNIYNFSMTLRLYRCAYGSFRFGSFRFGLVRSFHSHSHRRVAHMGVFVRLIHILQIVIWTCSTIAATVLWLTHGMPRHRHSRQTLCGGFDPHRQPYQQTQERWKATKNRCCRRRRRCRQRQQEHDGKMLERRKTTAHLS